MDSIQLIVGIVMIVIGVAVFLPNLVSKLMAYLDGFIPDGPYGAPRPVNSKRNSDSPAPNGFAEHVAVLISASPACCPKVREDYFKNAMSESDVLRCEVKRLSGPSPPPETTEGTT